jgi:hypothetical protein
MCVGVLGVCVLMRVCVLMCVCVCIGVCVCVLFLVCVGACVCVCVLVYVLVCVCVCGVWSLTYPLSWCGVYCETSTTDKHQIIATMPTPRLQPRHSQVLRIMILQLHLRRRHHHGTNGIVDKSTKTGWLAGWLAGWQTDADACLLSSHCATSLAHLTPHRHHHHTLRA